MVEHDSMVTGTFGAINGIRDAIQERELGQSSSQLKKKEEGVICQACTLTAGIEWTSCSCT